MSYDEHQAMWPQMIAALAAIDAALGIPDDGCNSTAQTLEKIRRLRAVEDKANSYIVDNARLAEKAERMRSALAELLACHTESAEWSMSMLADRAEFDAMLARSQERLETAVGAARVALGA